LSYLFCEDRASPSLTSSSTRCPRQNPKKGIRSNDSGRIRKIRSFPRIPIFRNYSFSLTFCFLVNYFFLLTNMRPPGGSVFRAPRPSWSARNSTFSRCCGALLPSWPTLAPRNPRPATLCPVRRTRHFYSFPRIRTLSLSVSFKSPCHSLLSPWPPCGCRVSGATGVSDYTLAPHGWSMN